MHVYGLVNQGLQDYVSSIGGDALWRSVRKAGGVETEMFVSANTYSDTMTYDLVDAASRVLGMPADELLRAFGKHWILYTARRGYGAIFDTMGRTLAEFLGNLDMMHTRLSLSLPNLRPPAFVCEPLENDRIRVEYRSERDGLAPMVVGLLEGLAEMYGLEVTVSQTVRRQLGHDHDEFVLEPIPRSTFCGLPEKCPSTSA